MYKELVEEYFSSNRHPVTLMEVSRYTIKELAFLAKESSDYRRSLHLHIEDEMRKHFKRYCLGAYGDDFQEVSPKWIHGFIEVPAIGVVNETLYSLVIVDYYHFDMFSSSMGYTEQAALAAKAKLYGCREHVVFILCRNTQKLAALKFSGDFSTAYDSICDYVEELVYEVAADTDTSDREEPYILTGQIKIKVSSVDTMKITNYLLSTNKERRENDEDKKYFLRPSEFTHSPCNRRMVYRLLGYEAFPKFDPMLLRIFNYGHSLHDVVQNALRSMIEISLEKRILHEHIQMKGSCDGIYQGVALEIKSKGTKGFEKLTNTSPDHLQQNTIYAKGVGSTILANLYVDKNTGDMKEFITDLDESVWNAIEERALAILYCVETEEFPEKVKKKKYCMECPYLEHCIPDWC